MSHTKDNQMSANLGQASDRQRTTTTNQTTTRYWSVNKAVLTRAHGIEVLLARFTVINADGTMEDDDQVFMGYDGFALFCRRQGLSPIPRESVRFVAIRH